MCGVISVFTVSTADFAKEHKMCRLCSKMVNSEQINCAVYSVYHTLGNLCSVNHTGGSLCSVFHIGGSLGNPEVRRSPKASSASSSPMLVTHCHILSHVFKSFQMLLLLQAFHA